MHVDGFAMAETTQVAAREQFEADMGQLFLPYRGFCARKGVRAYVRRSITTLIYMSIKLTNIYHYNIFMILQVIIMR